MVSTRGRYALRVLIDLANNQKDSYVPMKDVAVRQGVSLKYLEQILPLLKQQNLVVGIQGKGGGYRLTRKPEEYTIGEILQATEKDLAPVECLAEGALTCPRRSECKTIAFWEGLKNTVDSYLNSKTLADLLQTEYS